MTSGRRVPSLKQSVANHSPTCWTPARKLGAFTQTPQAIPFASSPCPNDPLPSPRHRQTCLHRGRAAAAHDCGSFPELEGGGSSTGGGFVTGYTLLRLPPHRHRRNRATTRGRLLRRRHRRGRLPRRPRQPVHLDLAGRRRRRTSGPAFGRTHRGVLGQRPTRELLAHTEDRVPRPSRVRHPRAGDPGSQLLYRNRLQPPPTPRHPRPDPQ